MVKLATNVLVGRDVPGGGAMNRDELKGKAENLKGRVKEAFSALTGDKKKQAEGTFERAHGAAEEKIAEVKRNLSSEPASDPDEGEHEE
jgi:uncharacterized protein YjbJ (UPF0337 family)